MNYFRRSVTATWRDKHDTYVEMSLTQFRDESSPYTPTLLGELQNYNDQSSHFQSNKQIPGTNDGYVWASAKPDEESGYLPEYEGRAVAQVGNILVTLYVDSLHPVKSSTVMSLVNKQLERL